MSMIVCSFDVEPLSFNNAYPTNRYGKRTLSTQGEIFKKFVRLTLLNHIRRNREWSFDPLIHYTSMEIHFFSPKFLAKGKRKNDPMRISQTKPDTSNCIKLLEDSICETLGYDDYLNIDFDGISFSFAEKPKIAVIVRRHLQIEKIKVLKEFPIEGFTDEAESVGN